VPEKALSSRGRRVALPLIALLLAIGLLSVAVGAALSEHSRERDKLDRRLAGEARQQAQRIEDYVARARSLTLVTANNPAFREFYEQPGDRREKVVARGPIVTKANEALAYLEELFPGAIGEACFIDATGPENARAVKGRIAPLGDLSPDETKAPFFKPAFALRAGQVYQARPYLSPDTQEWVIANATPIETSDGNKPAIVHYEVTLESFRGEAAQRAEGVEIAIVDARNGRVLVDSRYAQPAGEKSKLGRPNDRRFGRFAATAGRAFETGTMEVGGRPSALHRLPRTAHNDNDWVVVASSKTPAAAWTASLSAMELAMVALALLLVGFAVYMFRSSQSELRTAAMTDPLTRIGNRRSLLADMEAQVAAATEERLLLLALYDLDGFKSYNDAYGHPAGDALLVRLAARLAAVMNGRGRAYRMGGDEFCVLAPVAANGTDPVLTAASGALTEHGEGFSISASYGSVLVPTEAHDPAEALRAADQRMYAQKNSGRTSAGRQTTDVLMRVLAERYPDIGEHLDDVTALCARVAEHLELPEEERVPLLQAASLHDIGKAAIPDAILSKPGALDEEEWAFMRQHTVIGERILGAAPALAQAAKLVRASHERMDGSGYPDGLAGDDISLGARIIGVCDAYDAMTSERPYRPTPMSAEGAIAELRRSAGTQFDPHVVDAFCAALAEREATSTATAK
jgi:diguanylate cyclase (GGDEF)-like protein